MQRSEQYRRAKALAARHHRSLNSVMEEALRRMLNMEVALYGQRFETTATSRVGGGGP